MTQMPKTYVLDTETTGLNVDQGDRIIEIGVVELEGVRRTGRTFHRYINPGDKQVAAGAARVHGLTNEMLASEKSFAEIADDFLDFVEGGDLVIFNAPFDMGFLQAELAGSNRQRLENHVIDAMLLAKKRFPRSKLTLDAVAKKLNVDTSKRDLHGALIDADILVDVYVKLTEQNELMIAGVAQAVAPSLDDSAIKPVIVHEPADETSGPALLRAETSYSLFSAALLPERLVSLAKEAGYETVALTDQATTAGALDFADAARAAGIKPIVGAAIPVRGRGGASIVLYARNEQGWRNLQRLVTLSNIESEGQGLSSEQLRRHTEGLAASCGGAGGILAHVLRTEGPEKAVATARFLSQTYQGAFAVEITRNGSSPDRRMEAGLLAIAHELGIPTIGNSIARAAPGEADMVEVLHAIGQSREYQPDLADEEHLRTPAELAQLFADREGTLTNNRWFAELCDFAPAAAEPMLPKIETAEGDEAEALTAMAKEGLEEHLTRIDEDNHPDYWERFDYEIGLITKLGFSGYFLIVADFIRWARENGIPVGPGRGSGAGSIVAWSLGITKLDPLRFGLLFERFINPERVSLPDFDIDFCEHGREDVIRYVRERYGADRVVAIGTYGTFQARMAYKDAGRILGMPYGLTDQIAKALPDKGALTSEVRNLPEVAEQINSQDAEDALDIAAKLHGLVRSKSRHAAGIVIADRDVAEITALDRDPKNPDQAVTQYSMKPVEKAGLVKFDFLGLKTLTIIDRCQKNLAEQGIEIDPYAIPLDDQGTYEMLSEGHTMGVFQLEGGGITRACKEVRVDTFEDIIAIVALYRPGPMEFIPLYAARKKGIEPFGTPHPLLDEMLQDTYGIIIYQEQIMEMARIVAGYSLGEADILRRAIGKKIEKELLAQEKNFIEGCVRQGLSEQTGAELFEFVKPFAAYGFNRSHAAAYGLLAYITAYLKRTHPAAYMAAALDGSMTDTEQLVRLAHEARRLGLEFESPALSPDCTRFTVTPEGKICWALTAARGIGQSVALSIAAAAREAPFADFRDFVSRSGQINKAQAEAIAASGALDGLCGGRAAAITAARENFAAAASEARAERQGQASLFGGEPEPEIRVQEISEKEALLLEKSVLGLTLSGHPLDQWEKQMEAENVLLLSAAAPLLDQMPVHVACVIDEVKIGKGKSGWMTVRISDENCALTVGCAEDIENAHLLEAGALMQLRISSYTSRGEQRLRIDEVGGHLERRSTCVMDLEVDDRFRRETLRNVLADLPDGEIRIRINGAAGETFLTPPVVENTHQAIEAIRTLAGVKSVAV